jgi:MFS family permease
MNQRSLLLARIAISAVFFGNGFGIGTWAAQLPRLKAGLSLSDGQLALALLAFGIGAVGTMPMTGWAASRFGSHRTTVLASAVFAGTFALIGLAPNLPLLMGVALLAGAGNGCMDVSMNTNATIVEHGWHRPIMSSFHAFFSLGGLAGAGLSGLLIAGDIAIGPSLLLSAGLMGLLFFVSAFGIIRDTSGGSGDGHAFAWPRGPMMGLALLTLMCFLIEGAMVDWTAIYLATVAGTSLEVAAFGFGAFSLTMTACRFAGDAVVHRLGRLETLRLGAILAAVGLGMSVVVPHPAAVIVGFALVGLGLSNVVPILFSTASRAPGIPASIGVAMVATLGYGGLLLGPPILGFGGDLFGLRAAFCLLVVLSVVVVVAVPRVLVHFSKQQLG